MSESGGKLSALKQQARQAVATAPGKAIGRAAMVEMEPILGRLDQMAASLDALPDRWQVAADGSASALRESLAPMVTQVTSLRTSLEFLPTLLAQQTDGILAQLQAEGLTMRKEIITLREGLATLPDALATQIAPIVGMAESLDQVLALQRASLAALHEQTLLSFKAALNPTTERIETGLALLGKQASQTGGALQGMKALPAQIRQATQDANRAGAETIKEIQRARGRPILQVLGAAVLAAILTVGGLAWLGTRGSSGLPWLAGQNAKVAAWDSLRQQVAPDFQQAMDQLLARSAER